MKSYKPESQEIHHVLIHIESSIINTLDIARVVIWMESKKLIMNVVSEGTNIRATLTNNGNILLGMLNSRETISLEQETVTAEIKRLQTKIDELEEQQRVLILKQMKQSERIDKLNTLVNNVYNR